MFIMRTLLFALALTSTLLIIGITDILVEVTHLEAYSGGPVEL
jgi:hypothetical protein